MSECIGCGNCCRERMIDITFSDILRWSDQGRWDILREVSFIDNWPTKGQGGLYIEKSLKTKENPHRQCPFLAEDNGCLIHKTKPSGCSDAPLAYKEFPECPVFEKPDDETIESMINKQTQDIIAAKKNQDFVMSLLVEARNWQQ